MKTLSPAQSEAWKQTYPIREDINLYKLSVMSEAHSAILFDRKIQMNSMEEVL